LGADVGVQVGVGVAVGGWGEGVAVAVTGWDGVGVSSTCVGLGDLVGAGVAVTASLEGTGVGSDGAAVGEEVSLGGVSVGRWVDVAVAASVACWEGAGVASATATCELAASIGASQVGVEVDGMPILLRVSSNHVGMRPSANTRTSAKSRAISPYVRPKGPCDVLELFFSVIAASCELLASKRVFRVKVGSERPLC